MKITEGAFAGIEGVYNMADGERRAMLLFELLSKPVVLKIAPATLCKVS